MPPSTKDFVLEQQKELLPGWSLSEPASSQEADAAPQTIDKALKALNKERQKQIHAQLNKNVANQLAMQLDALHEDRMTQKQARRSQAAQSGSVHVDTEQERWTDKLPPDWPNAYSSSQGKKYKDLLKEVQGLEQEQAKLNAQRALYRRLESTVAGQDPRLAAEHVPGSKVLGGHLDQLIHLLRETQALGDEEDRSSEQES